jgi:hypothetical protein
VVSLYTRSHDGRDFETATCSYGLQKDSSGRGKSAGGFWPNDEWSTYSLFPAQQWSSKKYYDSTRTADQTMCATAKPAFISRAGKCRFWYESNGQMCVSTEKYPTSAYAANEGCTIEVTVDKFQAYALDFDAPSTLTSQWSMAKVTLGLNTFTKYTGTSKQFDRGMIRWTAGSANYGNKLGFKICTPLWNA